MMAAFMGFASNVALGKSTLTCARDDDERPICVLRRSFPLLPDARITFRGLDIADVRVRSRGDPETADTFSLVIVDASGGETTIASRDSRSQVVALKDRLRRFLTADSGATLSIVGSRHWLAGACWRSVR